MGIVIEDHGTWDDLSEYIATDKYIRFNQLVLTLYPMVAAISNRTIARIKEKQGKEVGLRLVRGSDDNQQHERTQTCAESYKARLEV